jgi:hypothetical protein
MRTPHPGRAAIAVTALVVVALVTASCAGSHHASAPANASGAIGDTQPPATTLPAVTIPAQQLADPGLPSQVGPGPLPVGVVTQLMQYFEDKVAAAYADNDADSLYRYLAGNMLTGNRASVNLLRSQGKRNVFAIAVTTVDVSDNEHDRITFDLTAQETQNYFVDTTSSTLDAGLPGPSTLYFLIFLDFNPGNGTWYWTGAQNTQGDNGPATPSTS